MQKLSDIFGDSACDFVQNCTLEIVKSSKRRTISISIHREGKVVVRSPKRTTDAKIWEIIILKKDWILKKVEQVAQKPQKNNYIQTGIFYFLGKEYCLKILQQGVNQVLISQDTIFIHTKSENWVKIFEKWIKVQALEIFTARLYAKFEIFSQYFAYHFPILKIRKMKSRWGSMKQERRIKNKQNTGVMTLSLNLIHASTECIDYVIMHELCHLKHQNHSIDFYKLQEIFVPNWSELKASL